MEFLSDTKIRQIIGARLKDARKNNTDYTQTTLGKRLNCTGSLISNIELGKARVSEVHIYKMTNLLRISPNALFSSIDAETDYTKLLMLEEKELAKFKQLYLSIPSPRQRAVLLGFMEHMSNTDASMQSLPTL